MNKEAAEEYTQSLGQIFAGSWRQIAWAQKQGVPAALELTTEQWVRERLGGYIRMSIADRRDVVADATAEGYSTREIEGFLGVDHSTIARDVANATAAEKATETRRTNEAARKDAFDRPILDLPDGLHQGDFRELSPQTIADETVDLVFTDPPYHRDTAHLYEAAAKEAARILKPGGSMVCYCGHIILPQVLPRMMSHLKYFWIGAAVHDGAGTMARLREYGIIAGFKPLLWFVKKYRADKQGLILDTVIAPKEKDFHPWQQSAATAEHFIRALTSEGGLVVDFFAGGGTTIVAAQNVGRLWTAFEIDPAASAKISERLAA